MTPRQGEIVYMEFGAPVGHEPAKRRPAVIASCDFHACHSSLVFAIPVTSVNNGYPLHIPLGDGLCVHGWACVEQMRSVDAARRGLEPTGELLEEDVMGMILEAIASVFGV